MKIMIIATILILLCSGCSTNNNLSSDSSFKYKDIKHIFISQMEEQELQFKPQSVHFVDYHTKTGNYLFRGGIPLSSGGFTYNQLMHTFRSIAKKKLNRDIPSDAFLIDISLLNNIIEEQSLKQEAAFLSRNPEKGILLNYPVYGALTSPFSYSEKRRKELQVVPSFENLEWLVGRIKSLIDDNKAAAQIIYVHWNSGHDRTGQVIGAYKMTYSSNSYQCVYSDANKIAERLISSYCRSGLQWYACYLKDNKGFESIGDIY